MTGGFLRSSVVREIDGGLAAVSGVVLKKLRNTGIFEHGITINRSDGTSFILWVRLKIVFIADWTAWAAMLLECMGAT